MNRLTEPTSEGGVQALLELPPHNDCETAATSTPPPATSPLPYTSLIELGMIAPQRLPKPPGESLGFE
jgi:hypothetical protein